MKTTGRSRPTAIGSRTIPTSPAKTKRTCGPSRRWMTGAGRSRPAAEPNRLGRELFYLTSTALMSVSVQATPTFSAGNPQKVFEGTFYAGQATRTYDVSADGQRFRMIKNAVSTHQTAPPASIVVVEHWTEELKQKLPTTSK